MSKKGDKNGASGDNVVSMEGRLKFTPSAPRQPGETPEQYRARYRKEKRIWMEANGIKKRKTIQVGQTTRRILDGELKVEDLDLEELVRGRPRAADGTFRGAPPKVVPRAFHDACIRELMKRGKELYTDAYMDVIQVFIDIAKDTKQDAGDRLRAAQYVWERIEGKVPQKVEVGAAVDPWQQLIDGIVAEVEDEQIAKAREMLNNAATTTEDT